MKIVMPEEKTELKILYEDGNLDREKPYNYSIELRKWSNLSFCYIDYILLASVITDSKVMVDATKWYNRVDEKYLLDANSDGEAIGRAVDHFRALEKECEEKIQDIIF